MSEIANKLFEYFVINQRYFAIQKNGYYHAKNQYINSKTIENILHNKNSFLCYQEDYNLIKWICFDFDVNKELIDNGDFEKNKSSFYQDLNISIQKLLDFLNKKNIDYLIEFSGNRGIHIWILFENNITRQDGYIIFQAILDKADIQLDTQKFSLDKYPKSLYSSTNTDKGTGVKIPLSFHQKSKKYSCIIESINSFDLTKLEITNLDSDFVESQLFILNKYIKQNKDELFSKLEITEDKIELEHQKHNFINSVSISSNNRELNEITDRLNNCKHLKSIFIKNRPNEKERRIVVGLLGQLQNENQKIGKNLLFSFFKEKEGAVESIIKQRLVHADRFTPPTCSYFRDLYNEDCRCKSIEETPLEFLDDFSYVSKEIFELNEDLFEDIKKAQIKYSKQNDEIIPFHTLNNLNRYDYQLIKHDIEDLKKSSFIFQPHYEYTREEKTKERKLYSISARDKIITTFAIKILDSVFYKNFSSHSFGYRFNSSFRQNDIFEHWLKQWNMYIKELKTLIYSEDFKEYYILKLDLKSFYDSVNLQKLQIELNQDIEQNFQSEIIKEEDKQIYFEIINNLINFSKQILNDDTKGLPQGPAYARYLAEFHLTSLDNLIEKEIKNKGYYYRFVDDMFIILPTKKDIDLLENKIVEHLATKDLAINEEKTYKGMINSFKIVFEDYVDNTKYFIDSVSRNKDINTQTTIHQASSKLLELIKNDEGEINDKNLTFLYSHLNDSKQIIEKKEELESYIINQAKGRGSFFNIFWRYYFAKYNFLDIDFLIFKDMYKLKRESFLNSLLIVLNSDNSLLNSSLKSLLDLYLTTDLSNIEKLSILEIYSLNNDLFNEEIIVKIGNDIKIYNDFILSTFSKNIPAQIIHAIEKNILELPNDKQFDYLYNLFFYSENNTIEVVQKFSDIFVYTVDTILNGVIELKISYLNNNTNLLKYIQIVYLTTLFSSSENKENFESKIYPIWKNLLCYIKENTNLQKNIISKLAYWKNKIEDISLEKSNIHFMMSMIKDTNYGLTNGFDDELKLVDNYFNFLIELIYLSNENNISVATDLQEIKNILITDKKVKYLEWLDGAKGVYYPEPKICIKNSIFNDITILKKENQILVRLRSELNFQKEIDYLTVEYAEQELIFDGKYKTIIYNFEIKDYKQINQSSFSNIYEFINHILETKTKLDRFCNEYHHEDCYINFFYQMFFIHKDSGYPLIPYDGFSKYFLKDNDKYFPRSYESYIKNILDLINQSTLKLIENDQSKIFENFEESFFPNSIINHSSKLDFVYKFNELSKSNKPQTIFELEDLLIQACYEYLADKKDNIFDMLSIYLSFKRTDKEYLLFNCNIDINDDNFESFLNVIQHSMYHNNILSNLFSSKIESIKSLEVMNDLVDYKKTSLDYEVYEEEYEISLSGENIDMNKLEYLDITNDELNFFPVTGDKLASLKNSTLFVCNVDEKYQIMIAPLVFVKTYSIIKDRKRALERNDVSYLFKPFMTLDYLRHLGYFEGAVTVLEHHYKHSKVFNSKGKIENHLEQWLRCFSNEDDIKAMLCIIGKHQYFSDEDVTNFVDEIKSYKDSNEHLITNIKTFIDNNGIHRLFNLQSDGNLGRELDLISFPQKLLDTDKKKIVFLADNIISGTQTKKAFQNYYLKETYDEAEIMKSSYHPVGSDKFVDFKEKLLSMDEIIFHSIFYTEKAVETINTYFTDLGYKGKIIFRGKEKKFDDCIFDKLIEKNEKEAFKRIAKNKEFLKANYELSQARTEADDNDEHFGQKNIVVRYNSMPTKRFFIFTHTPKYYQYPLFQYKSDFRKNK